MSENYSKADIRHIAESMIEDLRERRYGQKHRKAGTEGLPTNIYSC